MALHIDLPIYKRGVDLLSLSYEVTRHLPRHAKNHLGRKIEDHCMEMLDSMAMANASRVRAERVRHIQELLKHKRATETLIRIGHEKTFISHKPWADSIQLLGSIGAQGGGWLKKTSFPHQAPAA